MSDDFGKDDPTASTIEVDKPRGQLDIDDYLAASADASSRTRSVIIILIVASVLALTGLFNSLQSQWMHDRMLRLGNPAGAYMISKIGSPPTFKKANDRETYTDPNSYSRATELYKKRQEALCTAVETAYVEGSLVIRVPFFGFVFDVNDLGLLSSIGFLIILSCYRFFLAREIDNLRIAFNEALNHSEGELEKFYKLLAMRQVFTIPRSGYIRRSKFLLYLPKIITWVPSILLTSIIVHDWVTSWIGFDLKLSRFLFEQILAIMDLGLLVAISWFITQRLIWMDAIWDTVYNLLYATKDASKGAMESWDKIFKKIY